MHSKELRFSHAVKCLWIPLVLFFGVSLLQAQTKQLSGWLDDLNYFQNASEADQEQQKAVIAQVLTGIQFWLKLHPKSEVVLPETPPQPWDLEQTRKVSSSLREMVEILLEQDAGQPFELGATEVSVTAESSPLSPITDSMDHQKIRDLYAPNVTESIQYLPGLAVDHKSSRGQAGIMIRGFDTRQVGLYLDGIPIYVPYDGYADVSRFLTSDIGNIEVAKGYSSPLLGPNGLGGAVNLVTRQPEKKLEGDATIGTGSGKKLEAGLHLGSKWNRFFVRGGLDWLQTDYFPLSGDFVLNPQQSNYERANSFQRDVRYSARAGWTPREQDQYVLSYANQKADYGAPPYAGTDTGNKPKYWQWPYWNRESFYFNSNTGLGETSAIKMRAFYDHYPNQLLAYTNATYSVLSSATPNDDHSEGFSSEFSTRFLPRHVFSASFFLKDDTHRESGTSYTNNAVLDQPWRRQSDQLISIGIHDSIIISSRIRATAGLSADHLDAKHAEDLQTTVTGSGKNAVIAYAVVPFECPGSTDNTSFSACLSHEWDFNPLASISYSVAETGNLFLTFAQKSHFPTLKDRYSYKNGKAIPNPTLKPEHTRNWSLGYSHAFARTTLVQLDVFRSDVYDAIQNATVPEEYPGQCPAMSGGICQQSVNVSEEVHQGIEFTLRSTPISWLTLDANYSFLNRTISGPDNMTGVYPTGSPKHKAIGTLSIRMPRRALALVTARYESGTMETDDSGNVEPASKFATADLGFVVPIYGGLSFQTGVRNLFDRNYYYKEGFPEPGRNWHFSMRCTF